MKNLKYLVSLFVLTLLSSCSRNDDAAAAPTLSGQWKLVNVTGGLAGVNDTFPAGQITWNVNTTNNSVTVVNNNTNTNAQDILDSGIYNYSLLPDPNAICTNTFNINNMHLGCYAVSNTGLEITYEYADGFTLHFIR